MGNPFTQHRLKTGMTVRLSERFLEELRQLCLKAGTPPSSALDKARQRRFRVRKIWVDAGTKTSVGVDEIDPFGSLTHHPGMFFDYDLEPVEEGS
jgi:hypothetical protein